MVQFVEVFALLSIWNVSLFFAFSFVLLVIVVWHTSKSYSCTDSMDLRFRSRAVGVQQGEPALMALLEPSPSCSLSVIIPAFKEATRVPQSLKGTLLAAVEHLQEHARTDKQFSWEIIVIDDGSPDGTADSVIVWTNHLPCRDRIRVVSLPRNMGKGAAVKTGMYANAPFEIVQCLFINTQALLLFSGFALEASFCLWPTLMALLPSANGSSSALSPIKMKWSSAAARAPSANFRGSFFPSVSAC